MKKEKHILIFSTGKRLPVFNSTVGISFSDLDGSVYEGYDSCIVKENPEDYEFELSDADRVELADYMIESGVSLRRVYVDNCFG